MNGDQFFELRCKHGQTVTEVSKRTGIVGYDLYNLEGGIRPISNQQVEKIVEFFNSNPRPMMRKAKRSRGAYKPEYSALPEDGAEPVQLDFLASTHKPSAEKKGFFAALNKVAARYPEMPLKQFIEMFNLCQET